MGQNLKHAHLQHSCRTQKGPQIKKDRPGSFLSAEYLELREKVPLEPLFIPVKGKDLYDRLVLVVRKDSGSRSLADLKGKRLFKQAEISTMKAQSVARTLLMRQGVRNPERFFSSAREMTKPSASIFAVFFRKG